ncbi:hypothetical protein UF75_2958 [Desulfosporosinus sp. I2]|uniref:LCP family protein n=1 Tax=Desulfosporosinus sp. I2 TaxID=1617025 RepID=UPI00061E5F22|nr:LCP family protein [Desulfosporosinus sp. I2]KJR46664.1 hypothetical protein UF75_2958 [Desulfosporosinus sp. I2]
MKKTFVALVLVFGIVVGGTYCWNWETLHITAIVSQPTAVIATEDDNKDKPSTTSKGWINILVLGTDNSGDEVSRTDSMMLVSANVDTHQVSVISIPRDTRVNVPGVGLTKINHANAVGETNGSVREGTLESAKAVSNLLGVTINYYVKINFQGFQKAVDSVGGIDVNLPNAVNDDLRNIHLSAGDNHLSGDDALRLARARYGLPNGDFDRQQDQFYLLSALAHQMLNLSNIPKLPEQLTIIQQDLMDTNLSTPEMVTMGLAFKGISKETIKHYQLPGKGTSAQDPLVGANVFYYEPDMEGVREIVQEAMKL